ncbi:hypothetical protein BX616_003434, partial [Lobosporangium transversale]
MMIVKFTEFHQLRFLIICRYKETPDVLLIRTGHCTSGEAFEQIFGLVQKLQPP